MPGMALLASYIAQKEKIEGLLVCENARALRSEIQKIKDNPKDQRKALIIGSIMLNPESNDPLHKAVVCVEKKDGVISLIIIDSIGNAIPEWTYAVVDKLSPIFSEDCWLYMSEVGRQRSQRGCPVFAFQDAIAFLQDKDFLQRVTYKEEMSEHVKKIIELPPRFMIMAQSLTQLEEYKEKHPTAFEDQKKGKSLDTTLQKHRVSREENEGEEENRYVARKYLKLLHLIDSCLENLPPAQVQAMINSHLITSS